MDNDLFKDYLFLFDIDGTIIDIKGAGKRIFISAFEETNYIEVKQEVNFLGGIDNLVFKDLYLLNKLDRKLYDEKWALFQKIYIKNLSKIKTDDSMILPNAKESVKMLFTISNTALVTGNIREGAFAKLFLFGFNDFFLCGGFGDKASSRKTIVKDAIKKSEKIFNKNSKKTTFTSSATQKKI